MSAAKRREDALLSKELQHPIRPEGEFEGMPRVARATAAPNDQRMKDKVVIVTGANSATGMGRAASHLFAATGARAVYMCDFNDDHLATHQRELAELYPNVAIEIKSFDATDEAQVQAVCEDAVKKYGRLDVMFANAGITNIKTFDQLTPDEFMNMLKVNVLSVFLCAKHAAANMKRTNASAGKEYPGGSIVATASVAGLRSNAGPSDYSASKAAVISLAQTLAYQLVGSGIRVNALCPGIIETGMTQVMYEMARARGTEKKIGQLNPLRRGGVADEVARAALFLASDEASYINGQALPVDGGLSAGHPFVPGKMA